MAITQKSADLVFFLTQVPLPIHKGHQQGQKNKQNNVLESVRHLVVNLYIKLNFLFFSLQCFTYCLLFTFMGFVVSSFSIIRSLVDHGHEKCFYQQLFWSHFDLRYFRRMGFLDFIYFSSYGRIISLFTHFTPSLGGISIKIL